MAVSKAAKVDGAALQTPSNGSAALPTPSIGSAALPTPSIGLLLITRPCRLLRPADDLPRAQARRRAAETLARLVQLPARGEAGPSAPLSGTLPARRSQSWAQEVCLPARAASACVGPRRPLARLCRCAWHALPLQLFCTPLPTGEARR